MQLGLLLLMDIFKRCNLQKKNLLLYLGLVDFGCDLSFIQSPQRAQSFEAKCSSLEKKVRKEIEETVFINHFTLYLKFYFYNKMLFKTSNLGFLLIFCCY